MKKSLQRNFKILLLLTLFLVISVFCAINFNEDFSSKAMVFASTTSQSEDVSSLAEEQTNISVTSVNAINREYDGTTKVELVVEASGFVDGDDAKVIAVGNMLDANVGNKKYVEVTNLEIVGEDKDKYLLSENINISPVYVDISKKQVELIWKTSQDAQSYVYSGVDQISNISCYYTNILGKKVNVNFSLTGYQIINSNTYNYSNQFLNSGTYVAEAVPAETDANYNLIDSTGDVQLSLFMSRATSQIIIDSDRTFVYTGSTQDASECASLNNSEQTLSFVNNTFTTVEEGKNLVVEVSAEKSLNYLPASTTYTIDVLKALSQIDISNINTSFVYSGAEQSISSGATINNSEQTLIYQNNTFTTVSQANGRVVTVFAQESPNYKYVSKSFEISMQKATINTSSWKWSASSFVYNGKMQTLTVLNYNSSLVTASYNGASNTEAGNYVASVMFTLKDSDNYNPVTFKSKEWEIKRATITVPNVSDVTSTYSGEVQYACSLSSIYYTVSNNAKTNAGSYVVSIKLNSPSNSIWSNGSEEDITFNWTIKKAKVATPHVTKKLVYNGKIQTLDIENSDKYTILNQTASEVGEHYCYLILNDSSNYEWQENANSPILTLSWLITSSENYDESSPMVAVVITCILIIIVCIYITLHFTVVKKRRSRKTNKQKNANDKEIQDKKDLKVNNQNQQDVELEKVEQPKKTVQEEKVTEVKEQEIEVSLEQSDEENNEHNYEELKEQEVSLSKKELNAKQLENTNSSLDKTRKKRMLSRKKEDKKKRKKPASKSTEPKKRGRPPKKQVVTRGRPRRNVAKTTSKTKTLNNSKG